MCSWFQFHPRIPKKKISSYGIAGEINKYLVTFLKLEFLNQDVLLMGAFAKQEISAVFVLTFLLLNSFAPKDWVRVFSFEQPINNEQIFMAID